jgi:hypothetical protein
MSGVIVDRALFHLQSQSAALRPGDRFVTVIFEISASGFKVRVKDGVLKSIYRLTLDKSMKEDIRIFKAEEDARCYFKEQIELCRQLGFQPYGTAKLKPSG